MFLKLSLRLLTYKMEVVIVLISQVVQIIKGAIASKVFIIVSHIIKCLIAAAIIIYYYYHLYFHLIPYDYA